MSTVMVSFEEDIRPLFSPRDIACMNAHRVQLDDYNFMSKVDGDEKYDDHANARHVLARLKGTETPRMPSGGPFWASNQIDTFEKWIEGGFQK